MDDSIENRFMTTSPIFWYTGLVSLLLGIHYGKPRLFFSTKPTAEQILSAVHKTKVHTYFYLIYCMTLKANVQSKSEKLTNKLNE